ncbi:hypothetical protein [Rhizobium laguerreae]|uniref:hypothetical protein n=1 Tax=Rhizobium laguerreae TaxID=1076926 RepID=UPI00143F808C|nr:hypothetical protein [Rhizobium laguerreae]
MAAGNRAASLIDFLITVDCASVDLIFYGLADEFSAAIGADQRVDLRDRVL